MKSIILRTAIIASILFTFQAYPQTTDTIFFEDWESGIGNWWADNGVWEIGEPTSGPGGAYAGQQCAATVLVGNYPSGANSRLTSPYIQLPGNLNPDEKITLRFWHWFSFGFHNSGHDRGFVQISVEGGAWQTISNNYTRSSAVWTPVTIELTDYAGSHIRIGFRITDETFWSGVSSGWYIDNISISVGVITFNNPENWNFGIGDWWADNGVWQVGEPTTGPGSSLSGQNCAATILNGNYPTGTNSRLTSPEIILPGNLNPDEKIM